MTVPNVKTQRLNPIIPNVTLLSGLQVKISLKEDWGNFFVVIERDCAIRNRTFRYLFSIHCQIDVLNLLGVLNGDPQNSIFDFLMDVQNMNQPPTI